MPGHPELSAVLEGGEGGAGVVGAVDEREQARVALRQRRRIARALRGVADGAEQPVGEAGLHRAHNRSDRRPPLQVLMQPRH